MSIDGSKKDLRFLRTQKLLYLAIQTLLQNKNFKDISVGDICNEAFTGRTTFYSHYTDKYDFIKSWLMYIWPNGIKVDSPYNDIEPSVNLFFRDNKTALINLLEGADEKTIEVLVDFIRTILNISVDKYTDNKINPKYAVAINLYIGGIVYYILWLVKNKFSSDVPPINSHLHNVIQKLREWEMDDNL